MRAAVRRMGNSSGIIIPKPMLMELGVQAGDDVEMALHKGSIVISPMQLKPRSGWAEASKRIAAAGDDVLAWPEFGNADDATLEW